MSPEQFLILKTLLEDFIIGFCTEKKDLIESKKINCLNDFLRIQEIICLNETKFV